jgi:hypothetical protein
VLSVIVDGPAGSTHPQPVANSRSPFCQQCPLGWCAVPVVAALCVSGTAPGMRAPEPRACALTLRPPQARTRWTAWAQTRPACARSAWPCARRRSSRPRARRAAGRAPALSTPPPRPRRRPGGCRPAQSARAAAAPRTPARRRAGRRAGRARARASGAARRGRMMRARARRAARQRPTSRSC